MLCKRYEMKIQDDLTAQKYFNPLTRRVTGHFVKDILSEVDSLNIDSILDIGCGTGYITKSLQDHSSTCLACDLDLSRLMLAKEYTNGSVSLIAADVTKLPFKGTTFDLVVASEVLEHVPNSDLMLKEIKRVSRNYVIITVPYEPIFHVANFLRGKNVTRFGNPEDHIHHFNKRSLEKMLSEYFSQVNIKINSTFWLMATCCL
jgi:ubiquinone/menaquinone biosynthesis C-methylase UbiE